MLGGTRKLIIEVRVNEYAPRSGNPNIPFTPEEIGRDATAASAAGASVIHFHARNPDGSPAHDTESYKRTMQAIRQHAPELIVHSTLGQITVGGTEERLDHIRTLATDPFLKPEFASVDLGSTNIDVFDAAAGRFRTGDKTYVNTTGTVLSFAEALRKLGVRPCVAAWSIPFLRQLSAMFEMGVLDAPAYLLLVHTEGGMLGGHPATPAGLRAFLDHLPTPQQIEWTICCKEGNLLPLVAMTIASGGHVAIGIGDYAYPEFDMPTTPELVAEVARIARHMGRDVATPSEARAMLGIGPAGAFASRLPEVTV